MGETGRVEMAPKATLIFTPSLGRETKVHSGRGKVTKPESKSSYSNSYAGDAEVFNCLELTKAFKNEVILTFATYFQVAWQKKKCVCVHVCIEREQKQI